MQFDHWFRIAEVFLIRLTGIVLLALLCFSLILGAL